MNWCRTSLTLLGRAKFLQQQNQWIHCTVTRQLQLSAAVQHKKRLHKSKGKDIVSQRWLIRQISDPYVHKAKKEHYRCRSAYKLIEIDDKHSLLHPGDVVIDCGAAPGSWSQVAAERVDSNTKEPNNHGIVIAVDLNFIQPIPDVLCFGGCNFMHETTQAKIQHVLAGRPVNLVMSDMAPKASGQKDMDHFNIIKLAFSVLRFSTKVLAPNGSILCKLWDGADAEKLYKLCGKVFRDVQYVKPPASRENSAELFILCRGFVGRTASIA